MVVEIHTLFMPFSDEAEAAFLTLLNFLLLTMTEEQIHKGLPRLCEGKKDISKFFVWGFEAEHLWVKQKYLYRLDVKISPYELIKVRF